MARERGLDAAVPVPDELDSFFCWCIARGEINTVAGEYTGDRSAWIAARHAWAREQGWPGGRAAMLAGEADPDDDDDELVGLPHGGAWGRREGEGVMRCHQHGLTVVDH